MTSKSEGLAWECIDGNSQSFHRRDRRDAAEETKNLWGPQRPLRFFHFGVKPFHSCLRASIGSTLLARKAGSKHASHAATSSMKETAPNE